MRRLKKYTDFRLNENNSFPTDREEIIGHLKKIAAQFDISNATIHPDGTVDIRGYFFLKEGYLGKLPIKFGEVDDFSCSGAGLTTLEGCPHTVRNTFEATQNKLTNLKGFPKNVGGSIIICINQLTSLEGLPDVVNGHLEIHSNKLTSWKGCPREITRGLDAGWNKFTSLEGSPQRIGGGFDLRMNPNLTSLEGLSTDVETVWAMGLPKLYMMDKFEGSGKILFAHERQERTDRHIIESDAYPDSPSPIQQICQLFKTFKDFNDSLDYKYFKMVDGKPAIIEWRFREALNEFDLPFPVNPPQLLEWYPNRYGDLGLFIYVDEQGNRLQNLEGVEPYDNMQGEYPEDEEDEELWEEEFGEFAEVHDDEEEEDEDDDYEEDDYHERENDDEFDEEDEN